MSFTVTVAQVLQFEGNVRFIAQQMNERLRSAILVEQITGEAAYFEQVAPTAARRVQRRHDDSPLMSTQHLRRRISPYPYDWGDLIDREDRARTIIDLDSTYAKNGGFAMARSWDDEGINAFFATAYTGHSGSTTVTWPNGDGESTPTQPAGLQIAVNDWTYGTGSGNSGLTISKLISAAVALDAAEGDETEERFGLITARAKGQLLATTEATSIDYAPVRALYDGKIDTLMGFKMLHSERIQKNPSTNYRYPFWRKSALGMGIAQDIAAMAAPRPDKRFATYVYAAQQLGAARLEEQKLVEVIGD